MNFTCKKFYKNIMKFPIPVGISYVVCVYGVFVYLCVETDAYVHSEARRGCLVSCSIILWLLPLKQGPVALPTSAHNAGLQVFYMGLRIWT